MASTLASRIDKLETEILPPTNIKVKCSCVSAEEMDALRKGDNVIGHGDSWIVSVSEED